jgi:hypothetical protein
LSKPKEWTKRIKKCEIETWTKMIKVKLKLKFEMMKHKPNNPNSEIQTKNLKQQN